MAVKTLGLRKPVFIEEPFDRPNLYFCVRPVTNWSALLDEPSLVEVLNALKSDSMRGAKRVLIFCRTLNLLNAVFAGIRAELGDFSYEPDARDLDMPMHKRNEKSRVHMFHSQSDDMTKKLVLAHLSETADASFVCIIVCSSALALGVNTMSVELVIHCGAPVRLSDYVQQAGRAGRERALLERMMTVVLLAPHSYSGMEVAMASYINLNKDSCRRRFIFEHLTLTQSYSSYRAQTERPCCDLCTETSPK